MAEAFALGATVASVVGFAGQVLQGCLAIRAFLDDLEDAPVYIEDLKSILAIFEASLTNLKSTVSEDNASVELRPALEYSDKCIRDLEGMIRKLRDGDPDWERNLSAVRWKSKIMKLVENLKTARALLTGVQMNRVNVGLTTVQGQALQILTDARELKLLVEQTHRMVAVGSVSSTGPPRRRGARKLLSTKSRSSVVRLKDSTTFQQPQVGLANPLRDSMLGMRDSSSARADLSSFVAMLPDFQENPDFKFGYCDYLPGDYIEMAKDTIRGVLLDYVLEDLLPPDPKSKGVSCIDTSQINMIQKHQGIFRARGILYQEVKERQSKRGLGLVIITRTTTKWRASRMDNSFYLETKLHIALDPKSDPLTRLRLFCVTVFDGTPRYEPRFDPVLKVCSWVRYDAPIIAACRNGDLDQVRTLVASGLASPYDRSQARHDTSLLDVVFRQIILNLDQPANSLMSKLCMLFKYLVDQGLDPGELSKQYRHSNSRRAASTGHYIFRCSHCFEAIRGRYYDCKFCTCGDFSLCQRCIEAGQRCMNPEHIMQQPLQEQASTTSRAMSPYSPLENLASAYYTQEYAPYLVEIARIILCRSTQDPLSSNFGHFVKWRWYKERVGIESPVLSFISRQQEWMFEWKDETSSYQNFRPDLSVEHMLRDPTASILRAYIRAVCFDSYRQKLDFIAYTLGKFRHVFDRLEFREVVINHIAACIDSDTYFAHQLLIPTLTKVLRTFDGIPLLDEALNRCDHLDRDGVYYQALEGHLASKYSPDCLDLVFDSIRGHFHLEDSLELEI